MLAGHVSVLARVTEHIEQAVAIVTLVVGVRVGTGDAVRASGHNIRPGANAAEKIGRVPRVRTVTFVARLGAVGPRQTQTGRAAQDARHVVAIRGRGATAWFTGVPQEARRVTCSVVCQQLNEGFKYSNFFYLVF